MINIKIGDKFGKLTVINILNKKNKRHYNMVLCQCDCQNKTVKEISAEYLFNGDTKSCGCLRGNTICIGDKFGRLTIIEILSQKNVSGHKQVLCKCLCGNITTVQNGNLRNGHTNSCGCLKQELIIKSNTKHGLVEHYLYFIYSSIKQRCLNSKNIAYKNYGGRGIKLYKEWENDYLSFHKYIINNLGERKNKKYSLDRIDNNGNYEPGNLRWATSAEQVNNRRIVNIDAIISIIQQLRNDGVSDNEIVNMAINDLYNLLKGKYNGM